MRERERGTSAENFNYFFFQSPRLVFPSPLLAVCRENKQLVVFCVMSWYKDVDMHGEREREKDEEEQQENKDS